MTDKQTDPRVIDTGPTSQATVMWTVIVAASIVAATAMGLRQVLGLYLKPISMDLGLGREVFALAIAITNLVWGFAAPVAGYVADRYGAGRVVMLGCLALAAGFYALHQATSDVHLLLAGVLLGLGISGAGITALVGVAVRASPPEQRTQAISWIGIGSGAGMLVAMPYVHVLMEQVGWHTSLLYLAGTALLVMPLAYVVKGAIGTESKNADYEDEAHRGGEVALSTALQLAWGSPSYWLLTAGFFVCGFHVVFYATHLPAYVADQGLPQWVAVAALALVALGNMIGTWCAGKWGAHRPMRHGLALLYFGRAA
ncbi:MAG: MFS transporter, partial [Alphaproteobacteria bacterium]|nr:MFS transporter [Alphaproteobacteria bacterium]